jgi:hypothetical protein
MTRLGKSAAKIRIKSSTFLYDRCKVLGLEEECGGSAFGGGEEDHVGLDAVEEGPCEDFYVSHSDEGDCRLAQGGYSVVVVEEDGDSRGCLKDVAQ